MMELPHIVGGAIEAVPLAPSSLLYARHPVF